MIDRADHARADSGFIDGARRDAGTRFVVFKGNDALLRSTPPIIPLSVSGRRLEALGVDVSETVFLGLEGNTPWFAVGVAPAAEEVCASLAALGRFAALGPIQDPVNDEVWSILAQARSLLAWNAHSRYCPTCGSPAEMRNAGYLRACTDSGCGALQFPRSDPAVIVRITHQGRCLLARQPSFRPGLRSVLAGFVEPGESLEGAVTREVDEEVGLRLASLSYFGSQPWPFPTSLMVGFTAEAAGDAIRIDDRELESAEWITRARVRRRTQDGSLELPSVKSIARFLIDDWLNAE